jgi:threonine dehydrogenase-like Zn-dependent dehydrogenase
MSVNAAVVQSDIRRYETMDLDLPDDLGDAWGVLAVEVNALCGTDFEWYCGAVEREKLPLPYVPGHEPIGQIEWVSPEAVEAGWREGARVAVASHLPCGRCRHCQAGRPQFCLAAFGYGRTRLSVGHGLWGGFAQRLVLRPGTILHQVPDGLTALDASFYNSLSAGIAWVDAVGVGTGDRVLVLGAGQRGLAAVIAAKQRGASTVIITGRSSDADRLEIAQSLGADRTIVVDREDTVRAVSDLTEGEMVERVLDLTPLATQPVLDGLACAGRGAVVGLAGLKGVHLLDGLAVDPIIQRGLIIRGLRPPSRAAREEALALLARGEHPFGLLATMTVGLDGAERGVRIIGNEIPRPAGIVQIVVVP